MNFYRFCMRNASLILFVVAVLIVVSSLIVGFTNSGQMIYGGLTDSYADYKTQAWAVLLGAIVGALSNAVWAFFGAAILWLFNNKPSEAAE